jgi:hypothetical protein
VIETAMASNLCRLPVQRRIWLALQCNFVWILAGQDYILFFLVQRLDSIPSRRCVGAAIRAAIRFPASIHIGNNREYQDEVAFVYEHTLRDCYVLRRHA